MVTNKLLQQYLLRYIAALISFKYRSFPMLISLLCFLFNPNLFAQHADPESNYNSQISRMDLNLNLLQSPSIDGYEIPRKEFAYPPVFIHGFCGNEKSWEAMTEYLENEGYGGEICEIDENGIVSKFRDERAAFYILVFKDNSNMDFHKQGECVRSALDRIRNLYSTEKKFVLVGHSMGGLAARAYLAWYSQGDIAGLITIGTPHLGSYVALLPDVMRNLDFPPEIKEIIGNSFAKFATSVIDEHIISNFYRSASFLKPGSPALEELNSTDLPENINYYNIIGRYDNDELLANILFALSIEDFIKLGINDSQKLWVYYSKIFEGFKNKYRKAGLFASFQLDLAFSDAVVPVTSQYMRYIYPKLSIKTILLEPALHCRLEHKAAFLRFSLTPEDVKAEVEFTDEITQAIMDCQQGQTAPETSNSLLFLIDASSSMHNNDPENIRIEATKMIVDRLQHGDRIGIITFSDDVFVILNFTTIRNTGDRLRIKDALESISADGGTNISGALQQGSALLESQNISGNMITVLLTDGEATRGEEEFSKYHAMYGSKGVPIHTIGLTGSVNENELYKLASSTSGEYYKARSAPELIDYFEMVLLGATGKSVIFSLKEIIKPRQKRMMQFPVDSSVGSLIASISWQGSDLNLTLIKPDGKEINRQQDNYSTSDTYEYYTINKPEPGVWKAEIYAVNIPEAGEIYGFTVSGDTPLRATFVPSGNANNTFFPYDMSMPDHVGEILNAQFKGILTGPDGAERPLYVIRTGFRADAIRASISMPQITNPGEYTVKIIFQGMLRNGSGFIREIEKTIVISPEEIANQKKAFGGGLNIPPTIVKKHNENMLLDIIICSSIASLLITGIVVLKTSRKMSFAISIGNRNNTDCRVCYLNRYLNRKITVGRARNCKIKLHSIYISKYHCLIRIKGNNYLIQDLNSKNGIYMNGKKILRAHMEIGMPINIADYRIILLKK